MMSNHYETLGISPAATQAEVKQAYRRLVKQFHPDKHPQTAGDQHDQMARINAAYEVLGDPQHRRHYDRQRTHSYLRWATDARSSQASTPEHSWSAEAQQRYQAQRQATRETDHHIQAWLQGVFEPISHALHWILDSLQAQIDQLSADPFDDQLMEAFQDYLHTSRQALALAQRRFHSMPNPANLAGVAAHLYYCLNHVGDGIEELEFFTLNYDDHYLHTGQELFRIAQGLQWEAENAIRHIA
jgi:molecular chaperone DnaJ